MAVLTDRSWPTSDRGRPPRGRHALELAWPRRVLAGLKWTTPLAHSTSISSSSPCKPRRTEGDAIATAATPSSRLVVVASPLDSNHPKLHHSLCLLVHLAVVSVSQGWGHISPSPRRSSIAAVGSDELSRARRRVSPRSISLIARPWAPLSRRHLRAAARRLVWPLGRSAAVRGSPELDLAVVMLARVLPTLCFLPR